MPSKSGAIEGKGNQIYADSNIQTTSGGGIADLGRKALLNNSLVFLLFIIFKRFFPVLQHEGQMSKLLSGETVGTAECSAVDFIFLGASLLYFSLFSFLKVYQ